MLKKICVIVPAFNEGRVICKVVVDAYKIFNDSSIYKVDIIVVNDGSNDNTSYEARKAGAIVIDHILNSGAGEATATGMRYALKHNYDVAATMDADGQHDPQDVLKGINKIFESDEDLLVGSRLLDSKGMSRVKILGNRGLSLVTYVLFGVYATDSQSGLRIFGRRSLEGLRWTTSGYEFCSEMLWRASQLHFKINEFPIKAIYTEYSKKKGQSNWNGINIVKSLIRRRILETFE